MERNADSPIDNLAKDIRLLILSFSEDVPEERNPLNPNV